MHQKPLIPINNELQELLKIAEEATDAGKEVVFLQDDLFSFFQTFNIKSGEELVLKSVIYDLYKSWSQTPLNRIAFGTQACRYFLEHKKGNKCYFKVNKSSFEINKELLLYLEKKRINKTKHLPWKKHFDSFINFYKIEDGTVWIESSILKHLYNKWCYENRKKVLLSITQLIGFLKLYFKYKRNGSSRMNWFAVNEEFVKTFITESMIINVTQQGKQTNEKKQKTAGKISRTATRVKSKNSI